MADPAALRMLAQVQADIAQMREMERHEAFRVARAAGQYVDASRCGHDIDGWKLYSEGLY